MGCRTEVRHHGTHACDGFLLDVRRTVRRFATESHWSLHHNEGYVANVVDIVGHSRMQFWLFDSQPDPHLLLKPYLLRTSPIEHRGVNLCHFVRGRRTAVFQVLAVGHCSEVELLELFNRLDSLSIFPFAIIAYEGFEPYLRVAKLCVYHIKRQDFLLESSPAFSGE